MKKTFVAGALAFTMAAAFLSGCGSNTQTKAANRLEEIQQRGYIEVATEPYFAPNEFIDSSKSGDEQYVGSDIEMAKYIADKLGVELKIVPLEFAAVLSSVTEGKYDLAISALAYTPERAEAMNLSNGYYFDDEEDGYGLLVREEDVDKYPDAASLADAVIVIQSGSLQEAMVTKQVPAYKELKRVSATTDGFLMVQTGKADVMVAALRMARLYLESNPDSNLVIVPNLYFKVDPETQGTRIGIPKGEDALTDRINEIIDEVVDQNLYNEWYDEYTEYAKSLGIIE